jgi:hypothetical protein
MTPAKPPARPRAARAALIAAAALALFAAPVRAQEPPPAESGDDGARRTLSFGGRAEVMYGYYDATHRVPVTFASGAQVQLTKTINDAATMPYGEIFFTSRWVSLFGDFWYGHFGSRTTTDADFTLNGQTFSAARPIDTSASVLTAQFRLQVNPVSIDVFELGIFFGARWFEVDHSIRGVDARTGLSARQDVDIQIGAPQVGLSLTFFITPWITLYAKAGGMSFSIYGIGENNLDASVGFAVNFGSHVSLGAEWKALWLDLENNNKLALPVTFNKAAVDFFLQGPGVYVILRF